MTRRLLPFVLLVACGAPASPARPPPPTATIAPVVVDARPVAPLPPAPPLFVPPEQGLYDVEATVLEDTCWSGRPTTLSATRYVEVSQHQGTTFVYPHVDELPDLGWVTASFALGKDRVQEDSKHPSCPAFTKRQTMRTLASSPDGFTLERTMTTGDATGCPPAFTAQMPGQCRHVTRYVFTRKTTPPPSVANAPAKPPPCEKPMRGKKGPFAEPDVEVQLRARIPYEPEAERCLDRIAPGAWARLERQFPGITLTPTFEDPDAIERMSNEIRRRGETPPDLLVHFRVRHPASVDANRLAAALRNEPMVVQADVSPRAVVARP